MSTTEVPADVDRLLRAVADGYELIAQLRTLTSDPDPDVRSEALLRLSHLR
ncbi:hypothetical protein [Kitasatospora purpeofusca]|uniref:hypothetical protein n=1 Tax=Kitasatospora purpeofusca TaxID=67352 RepID=UPI00365D4001